MEKVRIRVVFRRMTSKINLFWEVFIMWIFWLAIIIMAEIHKVRIIRGADRES